MRRARKRPGVVAAGADLPPRASWRAQLELLLGDKRRHIVVLVFLSVLAGFAEAGVLTIVAEIATSLAKKTHHVSTHFGPIYVKSTVGHMIAIGFGLTLARLILQLPLSKLPVRIASDVQASLRRRVFAAFSRASWDVQSRDREGTLQEVMTNQTSQATAATLQATALITIAITFLVLVAAAFTLSYTAAGAVFVVAIGMFVLLHPLRQAGSQRARALSAAQVRYAGSVAESNRVAEESQVFGTTEAQYRRVLGFVETCRSLFYRTQVITRLVPNLYQSLIYIVLVVALWALNKYGSSNPGALGAVVFLLVRVSQNGQQLQSGYQQLQIALPYIDRLEATERRYAESAPLDRGVPLKNVEQLAFDDVSFSYNAGQPVLTDVSFAIRAGEAIGVVGPSGAGKSTLVQIVLGLRDPSSGAYLVNGQDVHDFAHADWTRLIAYVPQEPRLLHATVAENVRFFRDIPDEDIRRACKLARIHDDVESWSNGYETTVGPRADAISGGQQQRLCLARALAARPQVLVLDEPTSALDPYSETLIQESLTAMRAEVTLVTVAHRMSTLDICDRVMVILDGRLVAFDTRETLKRENAYYREASMIAAGSRGGMLPEELPTGVDGDGGAQAPPANGNGGAGGRGPARSANGDSVNPAVPLDAGRRPGGDWGSRLRTWLER